MSRKKSQKSYVGPVTSGSATMLTEEPHVTYAQPLTPAEWLAWWVSEHSADAFLQEIRPT